MLERSRRSRAPRPPRAGRRSLHHGRAESGVAQHLDRPLGRAIGLEDQRDRPARAGPPLEVVDDPAGVAVVARGRLSSEGSRRGRG